MNDGIIYLAIAIVVFYAMIWIVGRKERQQELATRVMLASFELEQQEQEEDLDNYDWMDHASRGGITSEEYYRSQFSAQEWEEIRNPQQDAHVRDYIMFCNVHGYMDPCPICKEEMEAHWATCDGCDECIPF